MIDTLRRVVERHRERIAQLQRDKARAASSAAAEGKKAAAATEGAMRTKSSVTARSKLRAAQRAESAAGQHRSQVADIERKIADEQKRLHSAEKRLAAAEAEADRRMAAERSRAEHDHQRRLKEIGATLAEHSDLHSVALAAIQRLANIPRTITVLFFAANPRDQAELRLDEEVRAIDRMIRQSKHRDALKLESRWAVRPLDILQAINELNPRVIHFSGHGSDRDELLFIDSSGETKPVSKEAMVQTLAATSGDIQLVFFNVCYSRAQAELVVQHVPAAIGMNTEIGDEAARVFSAAFYSAVGFGLSIGRAFDQAKAALMLEGIPEDLTPELFLTPGLDREALVLVRPPQ